MEQIEMFEVPDYHYYEIERHGRRIKGWVVPYDKTSAWSGAWYDKKDRAVRFADYFSKKEKLSNVFSIYK